MAFFEAIAAALSGGITLKLSVEKTTDGTLQVGILPTGKTNLALPGSIVTATPAELDAQLPAHVAKMLLTGATLDQQIAAAEAEATKAKPPALAKPKAAPLAAAKGATATKPVAPKGKSVEMMDEGDEPNSEPSGTAAAAETPSPAGQPAEDLFM